MNIGIDCIALPAHFSGAANYIINLTQNLLQMERPYRIQVYCQKAHSSLFRDYLQKDDTIIEINLLNRAHKLLYYEKFLPGKLQSRHTEIFLATHYMTPPAHPAYKLISIFHDMGFMLHKEYYPKIKQKYFQTMIPRFIKRADKIITVSQKTLKDLNNTFPDSRSKSIFIYPGIDHLQNIAPVAFHPDIIAKPFILAVNSFEKRKNIPFIIAIFNVLKQRYNIPHKLVLVGKPNNATEEIIETHRSSPFQDSISLWHDISIAELKNLYNKADFFINTSHYEGFGFTPVEAIAQGCPAFLYPNGVCRELFEAHPNIIDSTDPFNWAQHIFKEIQTNFSNKIGSDKLADLSWQKCASHFDSLFQSLTGKHNVQRRHPLDRQPDTKLWQRS